MRILFFASAFAALAACASVPPPAASSPKAFVIRHFEKETGNDPALTAVGQANAQLLADRLANERIVAVYSTDTKRTGATALPTATRYGLTVTYYPPTDYNGLAARVRENGGSVLIVGHSNTVPDIVERLSGKPQPTMDESRYGDLFVVDLKTGSVAAEYVGG